MSDTLAERSGTTARPGLAISLMLVAMLAFAAMDGVSKALVHQLAIPQILWVRYILFAVLVGTLLRRPGLPTALATRQPWLQARPVALYAGWLTAATGVAIGVALGGYGVLPAQWAAILLSLIHI